MLSLPLKSFMPIEELVDTRNQNGEYLNRLWQPPKSTIVMNLKEGKNNTS